MSEAAVVFEDLVVRFGRVALFAIDRLEVRRGEVAVLSGPNGAGKTTLLKIMAGLHPPDEGRVRTGGAPRSWRAARPELRARLVHLHQQPYLFDASVADNVAYGLRRHGVPRDRAAVRVEEALAWAGLTRAAERNARTLSGGERQRLAIARAHVLSPDFLLLDEPTANLDREARERTRFLVRAMRSEGIGIVLSTHETGLTSSLGDRRLVLRDGRLGETGPEDPRAPEHGPPAHAPARPGG